MEIAVRTEFISVPTGRIKTFGAFGPRYQVGKPIRRLDDGDWLIGILLVESGEGAEYRLARILADPEAV